jgi:hypothetical protein
MRDDASTPKSQRGQALILAMLLMTVIFAIGALVVDLGLWLSERRGAQTDADFAALAGAWELLDPAASQADATAAAIAALTANDDEGNASLPHPPAVAGNCITVDVEHDTPSLFSAIFGIVADEKIGGHATACAGATNAPSGIVPFEIDNDFGLCFNANETPNFNTLCPLDFGTPGGNPRGVLDLIAPGNSCSNATGGGNLEGLIESGVNRTCLISNTGSCSPANNGPWQDCVGVDDANRQQVMIAVEGRISRQGYCDSDGNGNETLDEVVDVVFTGNPSNTMYQAKDCDAAPGNQASPRLVSVIVLDQDPTPGNAGFPIEAFAGFHIEGCGSELSATPLAVDPDCRGGAHTVVYGRFVNLIIENSGTGPQGPSTASFSISLEE